MPPATESMPETRAQISPDILMPNNALTIKTLSEEQFTQIEPPLDYYRQLVYALYTADGKPTEIITAKPRNHTQATYVIAYQEPNPELLSNQGNQNLKNIESGLLNYTDIAGFFKLEHGKASNGNVPIEAMQLLNYPDWPNDTTIGYASQFSPNPLLPREYRLAILNQLFRAASVETHINGYSKNLFVILADHVKAFVTDSGIDTIEQPGATLNWSDPIAAKIFSTWPRYWGQKDDPNPPKLYKFIPFE